MCRHILADEPCLLNLLLKTVINVDDCMEERSGSGRNQRASFWYREKKGVFTLNDSINIYTHV